MKSNVEVDLERLTDEYRAAGHARRLAAASAVDLDACFAAYESREALEADLERVVLLPVMTSHPSEMRPPAVLAALAHSDDEAIARAALAAVDERTNSERPAVAREVQTLIEHFERVVIPAVADHRARVDAAIERVFGADTTSADLVKIRFHSWVGCDRDGNPFVTADATSDAARAMRAAMVGYLGRELRELALKIRSDRPELEAPLSEALELLDGASPAGPREAVLRSVLEALERAAIGDDALVCAFRRVRRVVDVFGLSLATLEWRQHSDAVLAAAETFAANTLPESEVVRDVAESLRAIAAIRRRNGPAALEELIISNCEGADVVFALDRLARGCGVHDAGEVQVVPLFETISALENGPAIVDELLRDTAFRAKIARLGDRFEIMVGYSDAAKDGGRFTADVSIARTIGALVDACAAHGVVPRIFHGRGGSLGRGYLSIEESAARNDPRLPTGERKWTEQGEIVANRYGHPALAAHTLDELLVTSLGALRTPPRAPYDNDERRAVDVLVDQAYRAYREFRDDASFMERLTSLTSLDLIRTMPFSSRPASRVAGGAARLDLGNLRAVPFNMAFNFALAPAPAWYGTGSALEAAQRAGLLPVVARLARRDPTVRSALLRAARALAQTDLRVLSRRASDDAQRRFVDGLAEEVERLQNGLAALAAFDSVPKNSAIDDDLVDLLVREDASARTVASRTLVLAATAAALGVTG